MNKAGGIISIIAGIFGVIAAVTTLFIGGMGAAFKADEANKVIEFGWLGVLFSFLVIVFGAMAFYRPKFSSTALIISSIFGIIFSGTLVAICMSLSIIGGILVFFGKRELKGSHSYEQEQEITTGNKKNYWGKIGFAVIAVFILLIVIGSNSDKSPSIDPLAELEQEKPSDLKPDGELAEIFSFGSKNTDLQRENKMKEIIGKVVQWQLPVYDVKRSGDGYRIQTQDTIGGLLGTSVVGAFINITPRNDQEKQIIEALTTGSIISVKGIIADSTMRHMEIRPTILSKKDVPAISTTQPLHTQAPTVSVTSDIIGTWIGDLEGGTGEMEINTTSTGFGVNLSVSGQTGCSGAIEGSGLLFGNTLTLTKKEDGQVCTLAIKFSGDTAEIDEENCSYYHGTACAFPGTLNKGSPQATGNNQAAEPSKDAVPAIQHDNSLDEANKQINITWNSATKEIRAAILLEQREWLKQRESDCSLKASAQEADDSEVQDTIKQNCMAAMTNQRTEVLKQKIASFSPQ